MTATSSHQRLVWIDHARAAGILLVVSGHAVLSLERSGVVTDLTVLKAVETAIYAFHMPLFFVLAGMTHGLAKPSGPGGMARALFWTIVVPYVLWSLAWVGLKAAFPGASNVATGITAPWQILLGPVDHFWFLYVLFFVRIAWYAVDTTSSPLVRHAALVVPLAASFVGFPPMEGVFTPWLLFWAAFYGVGVVLAGSIGTLRAPLLATLAVGGLGIWAGGLWMNPVLLDDGVGILRVLVALAGSFAVLALAILAGGGVGRIGRLVAFVGEASLAIFLTHTIVGALVRVALRRLDLFTPEAFLLLYVALGTALPAIAYLVVLRLGARYDISLARLVGFGTARRSHYLPSAERPRPVAGPTAPA